LAFVLVTGSLGAMQGRQIGLAVEPSIFGGDDAITAIIHLNDEWAVKPGLSYALTRVDGETTSSGFTLRTAVDYYLTPAAEASPYFGIDVGLFERETFGPDTEAENQFLTFLAPRAGAQVMLNDLVGFYANAGLRIDIIAESGIAASTFTTGLGVVLYVF
jgi:hypothetical protein